MIVHLDPQRSGVELEGLLGVRAGWIEIAGMDGVVGDQFWSGGLAASKNEVMQFDDRKYRCHCGGQFCQGDVGGWQVRGQADGQFPFDGQFAKLFGREARS